MDGSRTALAQATLKALFLAAFISGARTSLAAGIKVVSATYGTNCGAFGDTSGDYLREACDGKSRCEYNIQGGILQSNIAFCNKDLKVTYSCADMTPAFRGTYLPAAAIRGGKVVLDCTASYPVAENLNGFAPHELTMKVCDASGCAIWTFWGPLGEGYWQSGQIASLWIDRKSATEVVINVTNVGRIGAPTAYRGTISADGSHIDGAGWHATIDKMTLKDDVDLAGKAYATRPYSSVDAFEGLRWLTAGAALGNAAMETQAGYAFERGIGITANIGRARALYRAAAEQGYAPAEVSLAHVYASGHSGVPADQAKTEAAIWLTKTTQQDVAALDAAQKNFLKLASPPVDLSFQQALQARSDQNTREMLLCMQSAECRAQSAAEAAAFGELLAQAAAETERLTQEERSREPVRR